MPDLRTCLWFTSDAEAAVGFYTSLLPDSEVGRVHRPTADAPPVLIEFTLAGTPYSALQAEGGPDHNTATSIAAVLDTQDEADALYDALLARGGTEVQCGWVTDPWGISWQVIPKGFLETMFSDNADANARAYEAMMQMKRLDLNTLKRAAQRA